MTGASGDGRSASAAPVGAPRLHAVPPPELALRRAAGVAALSLALAELTHDSERLQQEVVRRVGELVGDASALWRKDDEGTLYLAAFHHADPEVRADMERLTAGADHHSTDGVLPHAWASETPFVLGADDLQAWRPLMRPAYQEYFSRYGMVSLVIVPLRVRGSTVALLGVSRDAGRPHDDDDRLFVTQVGAVVAVALDNDRLLRLLREQLQDQRRAGAAAQRAAYSDPLTGLPNRRLLTERLHALSSRDGRSVGLLLVDLDGFKHVNDSYGHGTGDAVLVEIAARLTDVVAAQGPSGGLLVRLGGDEFAVVLPEVPSPGVPERLAAALVTALVEPLAALQRSTGLSASVGVATGSSSQASLLLRHADIAMYRAKRERSGWASWDPQVDAAAQLRLRDVEELTRALRGDELEVHYQPIVPSPGLAPGPQRHLEALVRWRSPEHGLLLPRRFLPLAQQAELMGRLTDLVLRRVVEQLSAWRADGIDALVSVNVDAAVLARPGFVEQLPAQLQEAGLPSGALCVELTEAEALLPGTAERLRLLREAGLGTALDDFGTGFSAMAHLASLSLDRVKLDRMFVRGLADGERPERLVRGLVALVHSLGQGVVAEGVETGEQAGVLAGLGVEEQQGFWFARPQPAADLAGWLRS